MISSCSYRPTQAMSFEAQAPIHRAMADLKTALQEGDLPSAQALFADMTASKARLQRHMAQQAGTDQPHEPAPAAWQNLGAALKSGNLSAARQAFDEVVAIVPKPAIEGSGETARPEPFASGLSVTA